MAKIKVDKGTMTVSFKCRTLGEMKYILDTYSKGCQAVATEARESIGISDKPKLFLVVVEASVYDNDADFVVMAADEDEAKQIVREERETITQDAREITATLLTPAKTKASNFKEFRLNGKGIVHEYNPHSGDPELGA